MTEPQPEIKLKIEYASGAAFFGSIDLRKRIVEALQDSWAKFKAADEEPPTLGFPSIMLLVTTLPTKETQDILNLHAAEVKAKLARLEEETCKEANRQRAFVEEMQRWRREGKNTITLPHENVYALGYEDAKVFGKLIEDGMSLTKTQAIRDEQQIGLEIRQIQITFGRKNYSTPLEAIAEIVNLADALHNILVVAKSRGVDGHRLRSMLSDEYKRWEDNYRRNIPYGGEMKSYPITDEPWRMMNQERVNNFVQPIYGDQVVDKPWQARLERKHRRDRP